MTNARTKSTLLAALALLAAAFNPLTSPTALASGDAEATTHGDEAAKPQLTLDTKIGDVLVRQYQLGCLSQLTYLVGSGGEAIVIDPQRDVDHYIRDAAALGLTITKVFLTHTNADFVAGHTELQSRVGATIYISAASGSKFKHKGLSHGDRIPLGSASLEAWSTPGHTMDSMTLLIHAPDAKVSPAFAITGDTLFIGGIGRPDLVGGDITPMVLAAKAYDSIQSLKRLPDATTVLPAHGAGSLCGAHLSTDTTSTIGRERTTNPYLMIPGRAQFMSKVVSGLPVAPQYFKHNVALNQAGPPIVKWTNTLPPATSPAKLSKAIKRGAWVVDLRDQKTYAAGHLSGSVNVAVRGRLDTWIGIVVPFDQDLYLVGTPGEVKEATFRLRRVGYDNVKGYLKGGVAAWRTAGKSVRASRLVSRQELTRQMAAGTEPILVDVRTAGEHAAERIGDYANIALADHALLAKTLDPKEPVLLICNSAYRSSMAVGLAERAGFKDVGSLDGGLHAWVDAGLKTVGTDVTNPAPSAAPAAAAAPVATLALPEVIEASALARAMMDAPSQYQVIDVRPAWQFAEYHVPNAVNVAPGAVADHITKHSGRVVLVDRDGSMAFAIAGAVLATLGNAAPAVRVLRGGTAAYWSDMALPGPGNPVGTKSAHAMPAADAPLTPARVAPVVAAPAAVMAAPAPVRKPVKRRKRRSAGC